MFVWNQLQAYLDDKNNGDNNSITNFHSVKAFLDAPINMPATDLKLMNKNHIK